MRAEDFTARLASIRLFAMDADGVLTDGGVYLLEDGREFRRFDIKDGYGIKQAIAAGITLAIVSAGGAESVRQRARKLGITEIRLDASDKLEALRDLCARVGVDLAHTLYMGDDVTDIPALQAAGVACAPADAVPGVLASADWVTVAGGGRGAVREVCDALLKARAIG